MSLGCRQVSDPAVRALFGAHWGCVIAIHHCNTQEAHIWIPQPERFSHSMNFTMVAYIFM